MGRKVYLLKERDKVTPADVAEAEPLSEGWVVGEFVSGTICATDLTNMNESLSHRIDPNNPKIIGHECCFWVIDSKNKDDMQIPAVSWLAKGIEIHGAGYDSRLIGFPKRAAQMKAVLGLVEAGVIPLGDFVTKKRIAFSNEGAVTAAFQAYKTGGDLKIEICGERCPADQG
jgi:threonine dehydrogenase-like Zn-dependent dehydrogenase